MKKKNERKKMKKKKKDRHQDPMFPAKSIYLEDSTCPEFKHVAAHRLLCGDVGQGNNH